jgi:hypothetical protein
MEPANLKPDEDRLEQLLRRPLPTLPGHGFTAHTLAALPTPAKSSRSIRIICCAGGAVVGTVVALLAPESTTGLSMFDRAFQTLGDLCSNLDALLAIVVAAGAVLYALKSNSPRARLRTRR